MSGISKSSKRTPAGKYYSDNVQRRISSIQVKPDSNEAIKRSKQNNRVTARRKQQRKKY